MWKSPLIFATGITLTHKSMKCQPINNDGFTIRSKLRRTTIFLISTHLLNIDFTKLEKLKNLPRHFIMKRTESGREAVQAGFLR